MADSVSRESSLPATDWLVGGGEMGDLVRAKESWPQSLRTAVSLCLSSNFPINIIWGTDHTQIYNDGYRVVCGDVHPRALGENYKVTWASAWPVIGELFDRALAGERMFLENQRMFLNRLSGALEETFFTFSHSPIGDEGGAVGGLFHPVTETTATMLAERRTRALRDLAARLGTAADEASVAANTARCLVGVRVRPAVPPFLHARSEVRHLSPSCTLRCSPRDVRDAGIGRNARDEPMADRRSARQPASGRDQRPFLPSPRRAVRTLS